MLPSVRGSLSIQRLMLLLLRVWSVSSPCQAEAFIGQYAMMAAGGTTSSSSSGAAASTTTTAAKTRGCEPRSVYVNLPFCRRRCFYCDFPIKVVGDRPGAASEAARPYVEKVVQEIEITAAGLALLTGDGAVRERNAALNGPLSSSTPPGMDDASGGGGGGRRRGGTGEVEGVDTLFFGGGTPSLCPPELVKTLIDTVRDCFGIAPGAEISMEMDPGTFDEDRLRQFLSLGVNRVSMGVQSFDSDLLKSCGRAHSLGDVYDAVELIRQAGVENFSIDIMSGLPNQTLDQWERTLSEAIATGAAHISVYDLQVEAETAFGRWYTAGAAPLPQDETCADMYRTASRLLGAAGYEHYEISNYARPGFHSRHNRAYWENVPFLAFGNGAASYVDGHRFSRPRGLPEYAQWVDRLVKEGWAKATMTTEEAVSKVGKRETGAASKNDEDDGELLHASGGQDRLLDEVMLGFRLKEGLDLDALALKYGDLAADTIRAGAAEGLQRGWVVEFLGNDTNAATTNMKRSAGSDCDASGRRDGVRHESSEGRSKTVVGGNELGGAGSEPGRGGRRLRLSDPDGFLFSNSVISSVFCALEELKTRRHVVAATGGA